MGKKKKQNRSERNRPPDKVLKEQVKPDDELFNHYKCNETTYHEILENSDEIESPAELYEQMKEHLDKPIHQIEMEKDVL